jgi:hypothetical protein
MRDALQAFATAASVLTEHFFALLAQRNIKVDPDAGIVEVGLFPA